MYIYRKHFEKLPVNLDVKMDANMELPVSCNRGIDENRMEQTNFLEKRKELAFLSERAAAEDALT